MSGTPSGISTRTRQRGVAWSTTEKSRVEQTRYWDIGPTTDLLAPRAHSASCRGQSHVPCGTRSRGDASTRSRRDNPLIGIPLADCRPGQRLGHRRCDGLCSIHWFDLSRTRKAGKIFMISLHQPCRRTMLSSAGTIATLDASQRRRAALPGRAQGRVHLQPCLSEALGQRPIVGTPRFQLRIVAHGENPSGCIDRVAQRRADQKT